MKFTKWVARLFGIEEKKIETQESMLLRVRRAYAAHRTMLRISERMKARPERMAAQAKQRMRALKRAGSLPHKHAGDTEIEGDKPKYYAKGVLYKDGLGNHIDVPA